MTLKDCKARAAKLRRDHARFMAERIRDLQKMDAQKLLRKSKLSAKERCKLLEAIADLSACLITYTDEPAQFLTLVGLALKGKLPDKDELIVKALLHTQRKTKIPRPWPRQLDNALVILSGRHDKPVLDATIRRLKQLGLY